MDATYTVKQLADLAGVTRRTLHYYDQIGLLTLTEIGENGYRYYGEQDLLTLQQILFYREIGLSLAAIDNFLSMEGFDILDALEAHRKALEQQARRLNDLIHTVDHTIQHVKGEIKMSPKDFFEAFDDETQNKYEEEAMQRWDRKLVKDSNDRWRNYSKEKQQAILEESGGNYQEIAAHMAEGYDSEVVQAAVARWHQNLRHFYEPTPEMLRGLGQMYAADARFTDKFASLHPDLPAFLTRAIAHYCEGL